MARFYNDLEGQLSGIAMLAAENGYEVLQAFATSIGIGLLIGLERERQSDIKAGLRTFALVGMLGSLCAMLTQITDSGWILAAGLLAIACDDHRSACFRPTGHRRSRHHLGSRTAGLLYPWGDGLVRHGSTAVMLAVATTVLLYFKAELHGISAA
jgi:hypothetical protein